MGASAFDIVDTYVHLADGPEAVPVPVGPDFWATIDRRSDLHRGRLVTAYRFEPGKWNHWEMHPAGDEIVCQFSGAMDLVLEMGRDERTVELRGRSAFIIPRGVWHSAIVHAPSEALFITRGEGTEHRPA
ncbi:MAG TPA: cupin domain-containing protein [Candidatus Eisenbacteria bacterium]|nr:cupin domain-containing protein [Candidatus Eisenbacteria bacterium]